MELESEEDYGSPFEDDDSDDSENIKHHNDPTHTDKVSFVTNSHPDDDKASFVLENDDAAVNNATTNDTRASRLHVRRLAPSHGLRAGTNQVAIILDPTKYMPSSSYWICIQTTTRSIKKSTHHSFFGAGSYLLHAKSIMTSKNKHIVFFTMPSYDQIVIGSEHHSHHPHHIEHSIDSIVPRVATGDGAATCTDERASASAAAAAATAAAAAAAASEEKKVHVSISSTNDMSVFSLPLVYTFTSLPVITSIRPECGPTFGGTTVQINGRGFRFFPGKLMIKFSVARYDHHGVHQMQQQQKQSSSTEQDEQNDDTDNTDAFRSILVAANFINETTLTFVSPSVDTRFSGFYYITMTINGGEHFSSKHAHCLFVAYSQRRPTKSIAMMTSDNGAVGKWLQSLQTDPGEGADEQGAEELRNRSEREYEIRARRLLLRGSPSKLSPFNLSSSLKLSRHEKHHHQQQQQQHSFHALDTTRPLRPTSPFLESSLGRKEGGETEAAAGL